MEPRVSLLLSFVLSSLLLLLRLPFLSQATSSGPTRVGLFRHLESFGSFNHLEGSKKGDTREGIQKVKQYLQRYGYLSSIHDSQMGSDDFDDALESAMKSFQTFYHLKPTGILDAPTATLMSRPRCGVPDHPPSSNSINPDYALSPDVKWPRDQMNIQYLISPGSHSEDPIINGFNAWAAVSNFTFEKLRPGSKPKLRVRFQARDKGTIPYFDGPGGILAFANPTLDNPSIKFDDEESWSVGAVPGSTDLETVAAHEMGHILGLGHTQVEGAVMYATISPGVSRKLHQDDIDGIRAKYST